MGMALADMVEYDSEYDIMMDTLVEASARFEELEKAIIEVRHLCECCESGDVHSGQVLEVLERHGA